MGPPGRSAYPFPILRRDRTSRISPARSPPSRPATAPPHFFILMTAPGSAPARPRPAKAYATRSAWPPTFRIRLGTNFPSQTRNSILINARQQITPSLVASLDIILASNIGNSINSRGTITATVFGPTGNNPALPGAGGRNPFYTTNATVGTASQTIRYDFDDLLGPGAYTHIGGNNMVGVV